MTNVKSTVPHARHQRSYKSNKNAHVREVRKVKHGHALFHKIPSRPIGLEGNNMVMKWTTHSLTAYTFYLSIQDLSFSTQILSLIIIPWRHFHITGKKNRRHNKTQGKITFQDLEIKVAAKWRVLLSEKKNI